jgi:hypothetical protein
MYIQLARSHFVQTYFCTKTLLHTLSRPTPPPAIPSHRLAYRTREHLPPTQFWP